MFAGLQRALHQLVVRADRCGDIDGIDRYVVEMLGKKKDLIDKVIGEAAVGALEFEKGMGDAKLLVRKMQGKD